MKLPSEPGMQYAYCGTNDGISLAFQTSLPLENVPESGPGSLADPRRQTCILLMHGFSGSSAYFTRNYAALSEKHWVVAPDMRGHGASGRPTGGYHVARLAADLRAILEHLRQGSQRDSVRFVPVGCSIGAAVLWTYAELFGDADFAGFVFADQAPLQDRSPFGDWDAAKANRGCYDEATMLGAQRAWTETPDAAYKGLVGECLGYRFAPEDGDAVSSEQAAKDEEFFTGISRLCDGVWLARLLADHTRYDHREAIEGITKPSLVLAGRRTGCFPLEGMKETVTRVDKGSGRPGLARWSVFDSGHWMFYEEPERFNKEITEFVSECVSTGEGRNILDLPPDLPAWRERLFYVREPIIMTGEEFDLYWGYISNVWVPNGSVRPLHNGDQSRWYQCLLHTTRSKQLAKVESGPANRQRARTSREETFCEAAIKVTHATDGTVRLMRSNESDHDHGLARIDKIRRNQALKHVAAAGVASGHKPAEVFANLNALGDQLVAAGGQWLTRQDIINASRR